MYHMKSIKPKDLCFVINTPECRDEGSGEEEGEEEEQGLHGCLAPTACPCTDQSKVLSSEVAGVAGWPGFRRTWAGQLTYEEENTMTAEDLFSL